MTPEPSGRTFVPTTLCHILGIRYPIIQAPMAGGWTTPELGAAGAQMGTRFLLARESGAHPAYRKRLLDATEEDTLITRAFTGSPARWLRNRFVEEYLSDGPEPLARPLQSVVAGDIYGASQAADNEALSLLLAGQGLRRLKKHDQGAAEIGAEIVGEAGERLLKLGGALAESR